MADLRLKSLALSSWGRVEEVRTLAARPERLAELNDLMASEGPLLAHGLGRSYGDAPLVAGGGKTIITTRLNRLLSFDEKSGLLVAEAGVTFAELIEIFLPRGWLTPVSPGTAFVTLGGAIGNDVHGKNHLNAGSMGQHIEWLDLLIPSGEMRRCSRTENASLFFATLGGLGLTGLIVRAALKLKAVPGPLMQVTRHRTQNLDETMSAFNSENEYQIAWMDVLASGAALGRGLFESAFPTQGTDSTKTHKFSVPFNFPNFVLNPFSISLFNKLRYNLLPIGPHQQTTTSFLHPLDNILNWNRMYGARGFRQFQAVIPDAEAPRGIRKLLEAIASSRQGSFLATLKKLGPEGEGYLSFPRKGFTLALDFPNNAGLGELLSHLEKVTLDHGGRIYLAKDSALSASGFASMYPKLDKFRTVLAEIDPQAKMDSLMARRLKIRGAI
jgi:decaprenylphospho-beta-D-ribofuranose 2-oxidase